MYLSTSDLVLTLHFCPEKCELININKYENSFSASILDVMKNVYLNIKINEPFKRCFTSPVENRSCASL